MYTQSETCSVKRSGVFSPSSGLPVTLSSRRYEKLAEQEELGYQQQRRRLFAEVQQEKDRLAEQSHQQQATLEQTLREMRESAEREVEELKSEHSRYVTATTKP